MAFNQFFNKTFESDEEFTDDEDVSPLNAGNQQESGNGDGETKAWDSFRKLPPPVESLSEESPPWMDISIKIIKIITYIFTFIVVLFGGFLSKALVLLMTSQLKNEEVIEVCSDRYNVLSNEKKYTTSKPTVESIAWGWAIFFSFLVPEAFTFLRCSRIMLFKSVEKSRLVDMVVVWTCETLHVAGTVTLLYGVLPQLDVVKGVMLTNCFCFVPGLLGLLSRNKNDVRSGLKITMDIVGLFFQLTGFILWPLLETQKYEADWQIWLIPVAVFCISFGWWENYVDANSPFKVIKGLANVKRRLWKSRYFIYFFVTLWKCLLFFLLMTLALYLRYDDISLVLDVQGAFSSHTIVVQESRESLITSDEAITGQTEFHFQSNEGAPLIVFSIQALMAHLCYIFGKYACKINIQGFSFAFPVTLSVPFTISMLITACGLKHSDSCSFPNMPFYIFWECENGGIIEEFLKDDYAWVWLFWMLSQIWFTLHIWSPKCDRLASTERMFVTPMYSSFFVDQSLALNRRRDDDVNPADLSLQDEMKEEKDDFYEPTDPLKVGFPKTKSRASDQVTRIYVCATMWHENHAEMIEFLKSIFRVDEDQSARRIMQQYFEVLDPDYYEFETHIFFDDAFEISDEDENEHVVNSFVKLLVSVIEEAACHVHQVEVRIRPPKKYPTPYGGRLVWTLPGKTRMICHLKDKDKIRHKKRWSQVMYMYYLLGFKLMEQPIPVERKEVIAENTYLLALDGDIDFAPRAVTLLIDLMKKNKNLGAACGRIHPVGSGFMVWYQLFEYAIGHWMQKATEHVIGCVLCSPGCFALFRGKALMDDNVMAKYTTVSTQARHYVQFDQGEDRWLCTLLLQRGYRVEYSAASDAFTHAPEGFGEFYNQRRRWVPSTMANIMDLLQDYKNTVAVNDNISFMYIVYQMGLMFGSILGPGTIFLILEGSFVAAFNVSQWTAFWTNLVPLVIFMVVCFTMDSKYQIQLAYFLTAIYALVMVIVLIGMFIGFSEDGYNNPTAIFFFVSAGIFIITGLLHPQELICLPMGIIYYLVVPSMYLLLQIYSLFNLNDVSWGTREVATKKTKVEQEAENKAREEASKQQKADGLLGFLYNNKANNDKGSIEFSLAGMFKCMCCVQPKPDHKQQVAHSLDELRRKLDNIEVTLGMRPEGQRRSTIGGRKSIHQKKSIVGMLPTSLGVGFNDDDDDESEDSGPHEERDDLVNPYWMEDKDLLRGEVDYLPSAEIQFFKDLIEKYVRPLVKNAETQKKIADDLKELRNIAVFSFLMINSIFVLVVFILDLNKDSIHLNWPFGVKTNITYNPVIPEVIIGKDYLQLEPIGMLFVVFFGVILFVQFIAMLFHRFGTISHIMASTTLKLCDRKPDDLTDEGDMEQNALAIVKDWQKPEHLREGNKESSPAGRRATLYNIEQHRMNKPLPTTLDAVFKDRYTRFTSVAVPNADNEVKIGGRRLTIRRDTINAMVERRKSVVDRRKSMAAERRATMHHANAMLELEENENENENENEAWW